MPDRFGGCRVLSDPTSRSLVGYGITLQVQNRRISAALVVLGSILRWQGRLTEAEPLYLGDRHPNVATGMTKLGHVLTKMGRLEEAEQTNRGALDRRRTTLGEEHPNVAVDLYKLGVVLRAAGRDAEARAALGEALALRRRLLGDEHPQTIETLGQLEALGSRLAS